ncbi:acyl-CoA thioester hydrolase [Nocardioides cavernae]|uniref:Acyl-CoA thioester hydrolase n=1 Tax=Nocardioides cavernae TaxID=1921566 RepID=A0A7Y9KRC3_9ACTN|nr:thioesterase family protein [Nocardioides cavernae]NYE35157.1 acyl-CoA thioester hydrolase [Nocardioides cavernae]
MRHLYRCPLRWADLDLLGHVNNVTYVDYLQEARVDMFRTHAPDSRSEDLAEGVVVVRHEVTYVSSLELGVDPVSIECWVTEIRAASFTMAYEVFDEDAAGERTVYLRARTVLTPYVFATERPRRLHDSERESLSRLLEPDEPVRPPAATAVLEAPGGQYDVHVRFSDVDVYGHVNNVKYFEYFQEARIRMLVAVGGDLGEGRHLVVAQTDVDYKRPILFRPEPYDCRTWISRVGSTSVVFESVVRDERAGGEVLARARVVGVCMDSATGRPVPVPDELRALIPSS